ncbi:MAG: hypothetical protein WC250_00205 [Candidatus Paceibacterota bacterium]|jgi:hypothetical protein
MGKDRGSTVVFERAVATIRSAGSATSRGEQRHREGRGLHRLVDPKGFGAVRRSISWLEPKGKKFVLFRGTAMLEETRLDTTGSMGSNVEIAMKVLPKTNKLLAEVPGAVLGRYDTQMITSIFADVDDSYVLCRSQAEFDERIAEQMTYMVPEGQGGDDDEDPQFGLFGAAYLTWSTAVELGLRTYDFTITDACGRNAKERRRPDLDYDKLREVFGQDVLDKVRENGHPMKEGQLPNTPEIVRDLLKTAHAFVLLVEPGTYVREYWQEIYGSERVVTIPQTELLPAVKAAIIGLTEGTLTLQSVDRFLVDNAEIDTSDAKAIRRAVAHIPIGAQAALPNFKRIPMKGDLFAKKGDLWPIGSDVPDTAGAAKPKADKPGKPGGMWL